MGIVAAGIGLSLPTRERGLKYGTTRWVGTPWQVAPYAGAWIEIPELEDMLFEQSVAPYAGAWIEIPNSVSGVGKNLSLPTRERGLKFGGAGGLPQVGRSLPTRERGLKWAGRYICVLRTSRSLRGSVD